MPEQPLLFTYCSSLQFFSLLFNLQDTIPYRRPLLSSNFLELTRHHAMLEVATLFSCKLYDLSDTMPSQSSPSSCPIQPLPRKAEDFPRGGKYPIYVNLPTFLAYLQPV